MLLRPETIRFSEIARETSIFLIIPTRLTEIAQETSSLHASKLPLKHNFRPKML